MKTLKNIFLYVMGGISFLTFLVAGSALDSESWMPAIVCVMAFAGMVLFGYLDGAFDDEEEFQ